MSGPIPRRQGDVPRLLSHRLVLRIVVLLLTLTAVIPLHVSASDGNATDGASPVVAASHSGSTPLSTLNGRFLLLNMHGLLFHDQARDFQESVAYARWLHAGVIRVFATDANTGKAWNGKVVGNVIADRAPVFRAANVKLLVALVNNHQPVPAEDPASFGWMDDYLQLQPTFYTRTWRGAYLTFVRDLITTVKNRGALDVIYSWEVGNELHAPQDPDAFQQFLTAAVSEIRRLDARTPILPGTMGTNHLDPWNPRSGLARWLYCYAPIDGYTLHAYDWVSRERAGDMPIDWDLDFATGEPCPNGRQLPVIVEELGTSRELSGVYGADQPDERLQQELRQLRFVLSFPQVAGVGVWRACSCNRSSSSSPSFC